MSLAPKSLDPKSPAPKSLVETLASGRTGLEQLRALMAAGRMMGIGESLRFTLVEVAEGRAVFEGDPGAHALLDSACGCAVHASLGATQGYTTLELKVAYHKAMTDKTGPVRAEGRVVSLGRRAAFAEATLKNAQGKLYASATSTLLVFDR
jgi:hypothetical protein